MLMHRAFFVAFCVGLAAWTRQTDAKLSGTIGVWCGEPLPARVKCSSQNAGQNALQASTTEVLVESPVRRDHVKVLRTVHKYQEWGDLIRDPTPIGSRSSHSRGRVSISAFPVSSLVPFENSYQLFPFSFLFSPSHLPSQNSENPLCLPPPAPTANLPPGVPKKPQLQT
jgi:hypothetical protein